MCVFLFLFLFHLCVLDLKYGYTGLTQRVHADLSCIQSLTQLHIYNRKLKHADFSLFVLIPPATVGQC